MCGFCRSICSKGADPGRAETSWRQNILPPSLRWMACSRRAMTVLTFSAYPLYAVHTLEDKTQFSFVPASGSPMELTYGAEIVSKDQTGQATADIDAPIVFVGYGIHAPEYHWDDYAGVRST